MGMFDEVYLEIKCPVCKEVHWRTAQTKNFHNQLVVFTVGNEVPNAYSNINKIEGICDCFSDECSPSSQRHSITYFHISIDVVDGIIQPTYKYLYEYENCNVTDKEKEDFDLINNI